jgi:hypothetical protein
MNIKKTVVIASQTSLINSSFKSLTQSRPGPVITLV